MPSAPNLALFSETRLTPILLTWKIRWASNNANRWQDLFYVYGSVQHWSISTVQRDATQSSLYIILQVHCTCFAFQPRPSSVHKTVTTASGTAATSLQRGQVWQGWREVDAQKIRPVPEAVVTVLCTSDDGCGWHPKHVEWTCRIRNRLLCVESRSTIISIDGIYFGF